MTKETLPSLYNYIYIDTTELSEDEVERSVEQELDQVFKLTDEKNKIYRCKYCETKISRK